MNNYQLPTSHARAPWEIPDPGHGGRIDISRSGVVCLKTAAAETRTLPIPNYVGQRLLLVFEKDGGDCVVTVTDGTANRGINVEADNTLTFADEGESIELVGIRVDGAYRWTVPNADTASAGTNGPTLSLV